MQNQDQVLMHSRKNLLQVQGGHLKKNFISKLIQDQASNRQSQNVPVIHPWVSKVANFYKNATVVQSQDDEGGDEHSSVVKSVQLQDISAIMSPPRLKTFEDFEVKLISESISSDNVSLQLENNSLKLQNQQLAIRVSDLRNTNNAIIQKSKSIEVQLTILKRKAQRCQLLVSSIQKEKEELKKRNQELQALIQIKSKQLQKFMKGTNKQFEIFNQQNKILAMTKKIAKLENLIQEKQREHAQAIQKIAQNYQAQLSKVTQQFQKARVIGQQQINELLLQLHQKEQRESELRLKLHQQIRQKNSMLFSMHTNWTQQKNQHAKKSIESENYLGRFKSFEQYINERLVSQISVKRSNKKEKKQAQTMYTPDVSKQSNRKSYSRQGKNMTVSPIKVKNTQSQICEYQRHNQ